MSDDKIKIMAPPEDNSKNTGPCVQSELPCYTLDDYDRWYSKCENCGYDPGKSDSNRCWQCGRIVHRDFTDRALKPGRKKA